MPRRTKFMIMGMPRSGTTWLAELLHSHPDILCMQEPFNPSATSRKTRHQEFWDDEDYYCVKQGLVPGGGGTISLATSYLKKKVWTLPGPVVGFKDTFPVLPYQPDLIAHFLELGNDLHTICLSRNPIRIHLSNVHALASNQWQCCRERWAVPREPIALDVAALTRAIEKYESTRSLVCECCSNIFYVTYEDLLGHHYQTMANILDFLQVRHWALSTKLLKLQPGELRQLVTNMDEISEKLPEKYQHYLHKKEIL